MHVPPVFREDDREALRAMMREARLCSFVTATEDGLLSTPLPLYLAPDEGENGTLYGHLARANSQWKTPPVGEAMAIFMGPDAYVTPTWYAAKKEHGKVVPTWNYVAVHAYGRAEFFDEPDRLLRAVIRLTDLYEHPRAQPWAVTDAPQPFITSQLKGIVGVRMPISRIDGKRKLSQNESLADRSGVAEGLAGSDRPMDRIIADLIPRE